MFATWWRCWLRRVFQSKNSPGKRKGIRPFRPLVEVLEDRLTPSLAFWSGNSTLTSNWNDAANWQGNQLPSPGDSLVFASGAAQLSNTNDFAAGTAFGTILISGTGYTLGGNQVALSGGLSSAGTNSVNLPLQLAAGETIAETGGGTLTLGGAIALNGKALTLDTGSGAIQVTGSGTLTGTGSVSKAGSGTLTLANADVFSGTTAVTGGTLVVEDGGALGSGDGTAATATTLSNYASLILQNSITVSNHLLSETSGGTFGSSGNNLWTGNVSVGSGNLYVSTGETLEIDGAVSSSGSGSLQFNGSGRTILKGTSSLNPSYANAVYVYYGTLEVDGSFSVPNNVVYVYANGTLSGTGTVTSTAGSTNNRIHVDNNGTIEPGTATSPGTLTLGNSLSFQGSGDSLKVRLNGADEYDQINVQGDVSLNGAALSVSLGFRPAVGEKFTIVHSMAPIVGVFSGLGSTFQIDTNTFSIDYAGGTGDDIVLTALTSNLPSSSIFTVTNTNDDNNPGSLRYAINQANAHPNSGSDADLIKFAIPGSGIHTITLLNALPAVTDPVIINATTQSGYVNKPVVALDGSRIASSTGVDGLDITTSSSTVMGLDIENFSGNGIVLDSGHNNSLYANFIGVDPTGTMAAPNGTGHFSTGSDGITIRNGSVNNSIGLVGNGNVISGNKGSGITIQDSNSQQIQANFIGTDFTGTRAIPNADDGIFLAGLSSGSVIGSNGDAGQGNLIAFNGGRGVFVSSGVVGNFIRGNSIFDNEALGIDLEPVGVNASGNPVLTSAVVSSGNVTISGSLSGLVPGVSVTVDFYATPGIGPAGSTNGEIYLGSQTYMTDGNGSVTSLTGATFAEPAGGRFFTATVTDQNRTSEFSNAVEWNTSPGSGDLSGRVFNDTVGNGIQVSADTGVPGVMVQLYDSVDGIIGNGNDVLLDTMTTSPTGNYSFGGITATSSVYVMFGLPGGHAFTVRYATPDPTLDSDADSTGTTRLFPLNPAFPQTNVDAGLIITDVTLPTSTISTSGTFNPSSWSGSITGMASDNSGGDNVSGVAISIFNGSLYFDGSGFNNSIETFLPVTTGTTSWSYTLAGSAADQQHHLHCAQPGHG